MLQLETDMATITNYYEREFFQEMLALNILPPTIVSRVTDNIQEIIAFIQGIVDKGHAYKASDGGSYLSLIYFSYKNITVLFRAPVSCLQSLYNICLSIQIVSKP